MAWNMPTASVRVGAKFRILRKRWSNHRRREYAGCSEKTKRTVASERRAAGKDDSPPSAVRGPPSALVPLPFGGQARHPRPGPTASSRRLQTSTRRGGQSELAAGRDRLGAEIEIDRRHLPAADRDSLGLLGAVDLGHQGVG